MKKKILLALTLSALTALSAVSFASAHGVFFANRADTKTLVLGEGPLDNAYKPENVRNLEAYDTAFKPMDIKIIGHEKNISIEADKNLGTTVTFFDYGYFTKDKDGKMHHEPIDQVPNAVKSTHAIKYNVHYWNADVKPGYIYNVPIQIVPSVNPLTLHKGDTYEIQVFKDGKPFANAPLINDVINDLTNESKADENGKAVIKVTANGLNVVGVEVAYPTEKKGEQIKYFSSLSFIIYPEE